MERDKDKMTWLKMRRITNVIREVERQEHRVARSVREEQRGCEEGA